MPKMSHASAQTYTAPSITLSSYSGPSGSIIEVSGQNFGAEDDLYSIVICCSNIGPVPLPSAPYYCLPNDPNGVGSFSCDYAILDTNSEYFCAIPTVGSQLECIVHAAEGALPFSPGHYMIKVTGELYTPGVGSVVGTGVGIVTSALEYAGEQTVNATFTVTGQSVTITQYAGSWGTQIKANGTGFANDATSVSLSLQSVASSTYFSFTAPCSFGGSCFAQTTPLYDSGTLNTCPVSNGAFTNCSMTIPSGEQPSTYFVTATSNDQCGCDIGQAIFLLEPSVTLSPSFGTIGSSVTVTGTGFGYIQLGTNDIVSDYGVQGTYGGLPIFATNNCPVNNFQFSCTFTVPPLTDLIGTGACPAGPNGQYECNISVCGFSGLDCGNATFIQTVPITTSISPWDDPVGSLVQIQGNGFSLFDKTANVTFAGQTVLSGSDCPVAGGAFSCSFKVPSGVPVNQFVTVKSVGNTGDSSIFRFYVFTPVFYLLTTSGPPGTLASASYFTYSSADTSLSVSFDGTTVQTGCSAKWSSVCDFTVPTTARAGTYEVTVTGNTGDSSSQSFTVQPEITSVSPDNGIMGTQVTVTGKDFSTLDSYVSLSLGSNVVDSDCGPLNSDGGFLCTFTVPSLPSGSYSLTVSGSSGTDSASTNFNVNSGGLGLGSYSGPAGSTITVTGSGFSSSDTSASLTFGTTNVGSCPVTDGSISCSFVVPSVPVGTYTFTATGNAGGFETSSFQVDKLTLTVESSVPLDPGTLIIGASGFTTEDSGVNIYFDGYLICPYTECYFPANAPPQTFPASGIFVNPYVVPAILTPGTYTLTVTGEESGASISAPITITSGPSLSISPSSGQPGTQITVSGSGFGAIASGGTVYIDQYPGIGQVQNSASCPVSGAGTLSCTIMVPNTESYGSQNVDVCQSLTSYGGFNICTEEYDATAHFDVVPATISLNPSSGPAGEAVIVSGSGFSLGDTSTTIMLGGMPVTPPADCPVSDGSLSCTISVPSSLGAGSYTVTVTGSTSDSASTSFTVTVPTVSISPSSALPGSAVTIEGTGFAPSDSSIQIASGPINLTSTSGCLATDGSFSCTFTAPSLPVGYYTVTASGSTGDNASTSLQIINPMVTASPSPASDGSTVTITGSGFSQTDSSATVSFAGSVVTPSSACPVSGGNLRCTFTVPSLPPNGRYNVVVTGSSGDSTSTPLALFPGLTANPSSGSVGGTITLSGYGFASTDGNVSLTFGGVTMNPSTCPVSNGNFTCTFIVPPIASGTYTITATGIPSGNHAEAINDYASIPFTVNDETLSLTQNSGPPGTVVGIYGSGFPAMSSYASVTLGGTTVIPLTSSGTSSCPVVGEGEISQPGSLSCLFTVPDLPVGTYTLTVNDSNQGLVSIPFTVTSPSLSMTISPTSGPSGISVALTATGFPTSDSSVQVYFGSTEVNSSCPVSSGTANCIFMAPSDAMGRYTVTSSDSYGNSAVSTFTITAPSISATPISGPPGSFIAISGAGFASSDSFINISIGGVDFVSTASNACVPTDGYFFCGVQVPALSSGSTTIVATGSSSADTASTPFTITTAMISLSQNSGTVGTVVTITGSGLPTTPSYAVVNFSSTTVIVLTGENSGTSSCPIASDGTVSCSFTVPTIAPGTYNVTLIDLSGGGAIAPFTVIPTLSAPSLSLSATTIDSGQTISATVSWTGGISPYTVDLYSSTSSSCSSMSTLVASESGLTSNSYSFTGITPSGSSPYYCATVTDNTGYTTTSTPQSLVVDSALTAGAITPSSPTLEYGTSTTLTANPSDGTGIYSYNWYIASTSGVCSSGDTEITGANSATYTVPSTTPVGVYYYCYIVTDIGVSPGSAPTPTAYSSTSTVTVVTATSITSLACSPSTGTEGISETCTATVTNGDGAYSISPGGTITFSGTLPPGMPSSCTVTSSSGTSSSCSVTWTPPSNSEGSYSIQAMYEGDSMHMASSVSSAISLTIQTTTTTVLSCPSPAIVGTPEICSLVVSNGDTGYSPPPSGVVTFTGYPSGFPSSISLPGSCSDESGYVTCSITWTPALGSVGSYTITASYAPSDSTHEASTGQASLTVNKAATVTTVSCSPLSITAGSTAGTTCTATVKGPSPSGKVSWSSSSSGGSFSTSACTLTVSSTQSSCSVTYTDKLAGSPVITASYPGDSNNRASSGSTTALTVQKSASVSSVTCSPNPVTIDTPTTCIVKVTGDIPTGTVTFSTSSTTGTFTPSSSVCTLSAGTCSVSYYDTTAATATISVTYGGDANNLESSASTALTISYNSCQSIVPNKPGQNLKGADLEYCNLSGYDMAGDNLQGANMQFTNLQNTNLQGANLQGANLANSLALSTNFVGANLQSAILTNVNAKGANFESANLASASMQNIILTGDNLQGADLQSANLSGASAANADFQGANLQSANLENGNFNYANFSSANLAKSNMSYGSFEYADFMCANTSGANTTGANFTGAIDPPK